MNEAAGSPQASLRHAKSVSPLTQIERATRTCDAFGSPRASRPNASRRPNISPQKKSDRRSKALVFEAPTSPQQKCDRKSTAPDFEALKRLSERLDPLYGPMYSSLLPWKSSVISNLVGLICAQNTKNEWSAIMFSNLTRLWPGSGGEPNWDIVRTRSAGEIELALCCGPYYHIKAERIRRILAKIHVDFRATSLEQMRDRKLWPLEKTREYLLSLTGIGPKTVSCILLYILRHAYFPVDANVLKIGGRLGWFRDLGMRPTDGVGDLRSDLGKDSSDADGSILARGRRRSAVGQPGRKNTKDGAKRFAKPAQASIESNLSRKASATKEDVDLIYRTHVQMLTHGEAVCRSFKPLCTECPLRSDCAYARLLGVADIEAATSRASSSALVERGGCCSTMSVELPAKRNQPQSEAESDKAESWDPAQGASAVSSTAAPPAVALQRSIARRVLASGQRKDHHAVLGVTRGSSEREVRRAYRRLALTLHPDKDPSQDAAEAFKLASEALAHLTPVRAYRVRRCGGNCGMGNDEPLEPEVFVHEAGFATEVWRESTAARSAAPAYPQLLFVVGSSYTCLVSESGDDQREADGEEDGYTDKCRVMPATHVEMLRGQLFAAPFVAFGGVFPMHGTYFLPNEYFEVSDHDNATSVGFVHE